MNGLPALAGTQVAACMCVCLKLFSFRLGVEPWLDCSVQCSRHATIVLLHTVLSVEHGQLAICATMRSWILDLCALSIPVCCCLRCRCSCCDLAVLFRIWPTCMPDLLHDRWPCYSYCVYRLLSVAVGPTVMRSVYNLFLNYFLTWICELHGNTSVAKCRPLAWQCVTDEIELMGYVMKDRRGSNETSCIYTYIHIHYGSHRSCRTSDH
jgi:hypothetical protein